MGDVAEAPVGLTDEVVTTMNPPPRPDPAPHVRPARPADDADDAAWVDYCVALGADREFLTCDTEHWTGDHHGHLVTLPPVTGLDLRALAENLGG